MGMRPCRRGSLAIVQRGYRHITNINALDRSAQPLVQDHLYTPTTVSAAFTTELSCRLSLAPYTSPSTTSGSQQIVLSVLVNTGAHFLEGLQ